MTTEERKKTVQDIMAMFDGQNYSDAWLILQEVIETVKSYLKICLQDERKSADKPSGNSRSL